MISISDKALADFWLTTYLDRSTGLCGLCANTGIIHAAPMSPTGLRLNNKYHCVCPNGRSLAKHGEIMGYAVSLP